MKSIHSPTMPSPTRFALALSIIHLYNIWRTYFLVQLYAFRCYGYCLHRHFLLMSASQRRTHLFGADGASLLGQGSGCFVALVAGSTSLCISEHQRQLNVKVVRGVAVAAEGTLDFKECAS